MEVTSAALFISISLVVFGISYYYFTTRYKERMAIIEKGLPADFFRGNGHYLPFILTLGIVSIGISLGLITGAYLNSLRIDGTRYLMVPFAVFLFLGISLIISYFTIRAIQKKP
jgi:hypothetical protein